MVASKPKPAAFRSVWSTRGAIPRTIKNPHYWHSMVGYGGNRFGLSGQGLRFQPQFRAGVEFLYLAQRLMRILAETW